ncbi:MAG TPA: hypothetical protein VFX25_12510 [Streptosporangiaceae bacterium]|nr:hypothetical protein [Streptosporangiaceae bacterium]
MRSSVSNPGTGSSARAAATSRWKPLLRSWWRAMARSRPARFW